MATLLSKDQVKFSELNSDFSNNFFVSRLKLSKTYSPSVFYKDGLKLYVFESLKSKSKFKFEKHFWNAWNLDFHGVLSWGTLWRNLHMFIGILDLVVENKKNI